jgi:membrane-associated phospholipid phosphatase
MQHTFWNFRIFGVKGDDQWSGLLAWLSLLYVLSLLSLRFHSIEVVLPWKFIANIAFVAFPFAYVLVLVLSAAQRVFQESPTVLCLVCTASGVLLTRVYPFIYESRLGVAVIFICLCHATYNYRSVRPEFRRVTLKSLATLVLGYTTVLNFNYIFGWATAERLHDAMLFRLDRAFYGWMVGSQVADRGLFPLIESRLFFSVLEGSYVLLFVEIVVVVLVLMRNQASVVGFLRVIFVMYMMGLVIFFVFPVVGPCIYYPESFHPDFYDSHTYRLMQGMSEEYQAIVHTRFSVGGLGYFVGVPSQHIAKALILQIYLSASRALFWTFLPINILLSLSTVILGYHYVIDGIAGLALGAFVWYVAGTKDVGNRRKATR